MSLDLSNVSKRFGKLQAVRGASLKVSPGEGYAIIGPNGAGKTTLIKCLLRFYPRHGGATTFDGQPLLEVMSKQRVGYLPERLTFNPLATASDYLELQALVRGLRFSSLATRVRNLAERLDLARWLRTPLGRFSKGMTRKLAFIQAVMHEPRLLILDEPTDGLDPVARRTVLGMVRELLAGGATALMTSHLLADLERVSDRVGVMLGGQLVAEIPLAELRSSGECTATLSRDGAGRRELYLRPGSAVDLGREPWTVEGLALRQRTLEDWYHEVLRERDAEGVRA